MIILMDQNLSILLKGVKIIILDQLLGPIVDWNWQIASIKIEFSHPRWPNKFICSSALKATYRPGCSNHPLVQTFSTSEAPKTLVYQLLMMLKQ